MHLQLAQHSDQYLASDSGFQALMYDRKHLGSLIVLLVITEIKGLVGLFACLFDFCIRLLYSTIWAGLFIERTACRDVKFQGKLSDPTSFFIG